MKLPLMFAVVSSNIKEIGYDAEMVQLFVRFSNGSVFRYDQVPISEYQNLVSAESVGRYFMHMIKGAYSSVKVDADSAEETFDFKL